MNLPSIIILLLVALAVIAAARHLRRSDRHSACGGNCDGCQGCELMEYKKKSLKAGMFLALAVLALPAPARDATSQHQGITVAPNSTAAALQGFLYPPDGTRTKVWWFHGETETTREGITADLTAYRRQGVGGVVYYDQVHGRAEGADKAFSPRWWEMLVFAAQEAQRLGLPFETHITNGYVAGGPWITPDLAMQRLMCADTVVQGGGEVSLILPEVTPGGWSDDVAVVAFPYRSAVWDDSRSLGIEPHREVRDNGREMLLTYDFGRPFTARSVSYDTRPRGKATTSATNVPGEPSDTFRGTGYRVLPDMGQVEVSDDGVAYRPVADVKPVYKAHSNWKRKTISFPAVTARYYRIRIHHWWEEGENTARLMFDNVVLSARAKAYCWEEKAGLYSEYIEGDATPRYDSGEVVNSRSVIDLTPLCFNAGETGISCGKTGISADKKGLSAKGRRVLRWRAPKGKWVVMRFAAVTTGMKTKHGRANLRGPECDRLSAKAAETHWNNYCRPIIDTLKAHAVALHGIAMDSHEAGAQNWTADFESRFRSLRGYDLRRLLPVMAGCVVDSRERTDTLLRDIRRTIADLTATEHYATFQRLCAAEGLTFTAQATGNALCMVADQLQAKAMVDKPQGEFWAIHPDGNYDIKESSSAAHLYGKPIASGEAFTDAKFSHSLGYIKQLADYAYAFGINEFVVCASAYQPHTTKIPWNTGGGRHYCLNRNNTLWPYSRGFWDYQSRMSHLMRQGVPVVDCLLYLGDNAPVKILTHRLPVLPRGCDFDAATAHALLNRIEVSEGRLVTPDGMSYSVLMLPKKDVPYGVVKEKIERLKKDGATVVEHGDTLWARQPDLTLPAGRKVYFTHRRLTDGDIYFIVNHEDSPLEHTFVMRSRRKYAEIWDAVTGGRRAVAQSVTHDGRTAVTLALAARESAVVVLTDSPTVSAPAKATEKAETLTRIDGGWSVEFDKAMGGPGMVTFPSLHDWTQDTDGRIRNYSGTAVYRKRVTLPKPSGEDRVLLRFDNLRDVAEVLVDGRSMGTVWCSPWQVDITAALNGVAAAADTVEAALEIRVSNTLTNRMTADAALPQEQRVTYSDTPIARAGDPLVPSGIIGGVWIVTASQSAPSVK